MRRGTGEGRKKKKLLNLKAKKKKALGAKERVLTGGCRQATV